MAGRVSERTEVAAAGKCFALHASQTHTLSKRNIQVSLKS